MAYRHGNDVTIIGGGLIGLTLAEALARRGADVAVLEAKTPGSGASSGNAGWVTTALAAPVPTPKIIGRTMKWWIDPRGPFRLRPRISLGLASWARQFKVATNERRYAQGTAALVALALRAAEDLDRLAGHVHFETRTQDLLIVADHERDLDREAKELSAIATAGSPAQVKRIGPRELAEIEPAISASSGALLVSGERQVRPENLVEGLVDHLRTSGAEVATDDPVESIVRRRGGWESRLRSGELRCSHSVVLAAGWRSASLTRGLGLKLPLQGGRGYSVTVPSDDLTLQHAIYLLERRVAITPFKESIRAAGMMDIGYQDERVPPGRIKVLEHAVRRTIPGWPRASARTWAGMRPMFPDGLPVIGELPGCQGLHLATGHSMLGVTLAPTTAELLAPVVLGDKAPPLLDPFSAARFM